MEGSDLAGYGLREFSLVSGIQARVAEDEHKIPSPRQERLVPGRETGPGQARSARTREIGHIWNDTVNMCGCW